MENERKIEEAKFCDEELNDLLVELETDEKLTKNLVCIKLNFTTTFKWR